MNPFGSLAAGYASSRPAVHPLVMEKACRHLRHTYARALDIGCGSGLSTRPLVSLAQTTIGLEPAHSMLRFAGGIAPHARFVTGAAENLPFRDASIDVITAAGSLNYADLGRFFPEARRVLTPGGVIIVYDFTPGRSFPGSPALSDWFAEFERRYPWPPAEGRVLSPATLADFAGDSYHLEHQEDFEVSLTLSPAFYTGYMMTETNVAYAIRRGVSEEEIRTWCAGTVNGVFGGTDREVLFRGYIAYLRLTTTAVP